MIQLLIENESDLYNPYDPSRTRINEGVLGVLFCAFGIMLSVYLDEVLLTVISLLGTMGIMDTITINTTVNHDLKTLKKLLEPISDIRLEVVQRSGVS